MESFIFYLPTYFFHCSLDSFVEFRKSFETEKTRQILEIDLHFLVIKRPADFFLRIVLVNKYVVTYLSS